MKQKSLWHTSDARQTIGFLAVVATLGPPLSVVLATLSIARRRGDLPLRTWSLSSPSWLIRGFHHCCPHRWWQLRGLLRLWWLHLKKVIPFRSSPPLHPHLDATVYSVVPICIIQDPTTGVADLGIVLKHITIECLGWRTTNCEVWASVIRKFRECEPIQQFSRTRISKTTKEGLHSLVQPLNLTIQLIRGDNWNSYAETP